MTTPILMDFPWFRLVITNPGVTGDAGDYDLTCCLVKTKMYTLYLHKGTIRDTFVIHIH